jgi:hypothetical protein
MSLWPHSFVESVLGLLDLIQTSQTSIGPTFDSSDSPTISGSFHPLSAERVVSHDIVETYYHVVVMQYTLAAAAVIWTFDFLLTLDDEVELVWQRGSRRLVKTLYLLVSYLPSTTNINYSKSSRVRDITP